MQETYSAFSLLFYPAKIVTLPRAFCRQSRVTFHAWYSSSSHRAALWGWSLSGWSAPRTQPAAPPPSPPSAQSVDRVERIQYPSAEVIIIRFCILYFVFCLTFLPTIASGADPAPHLTDGRSDSLDWRLCKEWIEIIMKRLNSNANWFSTMEYGYLKMWCLIFRFSDLQWFGANPS